MYRVFSRPGYAALAIAAAAFTFVVTLIAHNFRFLFDFLSLQQVSLSDAMMFLPIFVIESIAGTPRLDLILAAISAVLIGIVVSLSLFYARMHRAAPSLASGVGFLGAISAFLGFGCAACGTVFLASAFAGSLGGIAALLPYGGKEISFLGIGLLGMAAYTLARSISRPAVCPI